MPNIAPRKLALKSELPPLRFFSRSCRTGEPENSAPSLASICLTTTTIHPAQPATSSAHQKVGIAITPRLRA